MKSKLQSPVKTLRVAGIELPHESRENTAPIELQIIRANEFVCLDANELLDFEATKKVLQGLALACRKRGLDRAMLDLRAVPVPAKPHFTLEELAELVATFAQAGFTRHQRLAILYQHDVYGGVRNFAFFSKMHGLQVQAFHDFEEALYWLSTGHDDVTELQTGIPVPIKKRRLLKRPGVSGISPAITAQPVRISAKRKQM
jgi:hypothetical protein